MGYPAPGPAAYGAAMKHRGPIAVWLGLPLITLGIYGIVWHYKVNKEMGQFDPRRPVNPVMSVLAVTLGVFLIVPPFVSVYNTGKRIREAQRAAGVEPTCSAGLGVFLMFFCSLYVLYYQSQLNKVVERYGDVAPGTQVPLAV
ncbi:DUF4234 domain-containing protein [Streptomyces sp. UNOC14_S4]|nr:DUF4234 domain-containing protein [Streptomyces sp. UNOC14_S4]